MSYDPQAVQSLRPSSSPAPWLLLLVTIAGAGSGAWWLNQDRQKARTDAGAATLKAAEATAAQKELTQKVEALEGEKTALAAEKTALAADKAELSKDVAAKAGELAELKGTYDKLEEKMKDEIAKGDISLSQDGGKLRVGLVDKILFDSGEAQISKRGEGVLGRVGAVLAAIDDKQIQVSGHTDKTPISEKLAPQFPTNWELSAARATNVVRFLSEKAGVPAERLVASGYGEFHPVASNKSPAGRARNRRIEILLTPTLAPKAIASKAGPSKPSPSKPAPSKPVQRVANNTKPSKR
jgi:chemotaxis protein MotB